MVDSKYLINGEKLLIDALKQINGIGTGPLCLFVINDNGVMLGTLTDGDIRRALIKGATINDSVKYAMNKDFNCLLGKELIRRLTDLNGISLFFISVENCCPPIFPYQPCSVIEINRICSLSRKQFFCLPGSKQIAAGIFRQFSECNLIHIK